MCVIVCVCLCVRDHVCCLCIYVRVCVCFVFVFGCARLRAFVCMHADMLFCVAPHMCGKAQFGEQDGGAWPWGARLG